MVGNKKDKIIEEHFDSLWQRYKKSLEESMKDIKFVFDDLDLLYHKCHKIMSNCRGSYI